MRLTGNYHDLGSFASDIANLPRIVTLNNLNAHGRSRMVADLDATAKTFRYLDEEEIGNQRKARRPAATKK